MFTIVGALFLGFGWGRSAERDAATSSITTSPTTTAPTQPVSTTMSVNSVTAGLILAFEPDTVATLRTLAESYEAVDRVLDPTAEAALIAYGVAIASGGQARADNMIEPMRGTLDELDGAIWALSNEALGQLLEQLDPFARNAIDRYLSVFPASPTDFDRFLEATGHPLNLTEIYVLLDVLEYHLGIDLLGPTG